MLKLDVFVLNGDRLDAAKHGNFGFKARIGEPSQD